MALQVETDFPGGSLGELREIGRDSFRARLVRDVNAEGRNGTALWYCFRVRGVEGDTLTFTLEDLLDEWNYRPSQPFNARSHPLYSYDGEHWQPAPHVEYDERAYTLRASLPWRGEVVWVACLEPYPLPFHAALVERIARQGGAEHEVLGHSVEGRPLDGFTFGRPLDVQGRPNPTAWVIARQHPWETHTSYAAEGLIERVAQWAPEALQSICLRVVPLANPDGVARAGTRYNARRRDPNRDYDQADPLDAPESYALLRALRTWTDAGRRIDLFINLHNTATDYIDAYAAPVRDGRPLLFGGLLAHRTFFRGPVRYQSSTPFALSDPNGLHLLLEMRAWDVPALGRQVLRADAKAFGAGLAEAIRDYFRLLGEAAASPG